MKCTFFVLGACAPVAFASSDSDSCADATAMLQMRNVVSDLRRHKSAETTKDTKSSDQEQSPLWEEHEPARPIEGLGRMCGVPNLEACGGLCAADPTYLPWCDTMIPFSDCDVRNEVATQQECQDLAEARNHEFYNFGFCPAVQRSYCITTPTCNMVDVPPPWQMYKAPPSNAELQDHLEHLHDMGAQAVDELWTGHEMQNAGITANREAIENLHDIGSHIMEGIHDALDHSHAGIDANRQAIENLHDMGSQAIDEIHDALGHSRAGIDANRQAIDHLHDMGSQAIDELHGAVGHSHARIDELHAMGSESIVGLQDQVDSLEERFDALESQVEALTAMSWSQSGDDNQKCQGDNFWVDTYDDCMQAAEDAGATWACYRHDNPSGGGQYKCRFTLDAECEITSGTSNLWRMYHLSASR